MKSHSLFRSAVKKWKSHEINNMVFMESGILLLSSKYKSNLFDLSKSRAKNGQVYTKQKVKQLSIFKIKIITYKVNHLLIYCCI